MIVLDASVLLAQLDRDDAHHAAARQRLRTVAEQRLGIGASTITLAEVLVSPTRAGTLGSASAALRALEIEELPLPRGAAEQLAALRADTGLKLPDCCVLLAAEAAGGAVLTFDERLAREAAQRNLAA
jgi:predicted nucleic acid-binding protein